MRTDARVEDLLRRLAPQVLGALVRRYGHFDTCEDATQEALLAAAVQWPEDGLPDRPRAWLITVAARRLTDALRSDEARRRREDTDAVRTPTDQLVAPAPDDNGRGEHDDTLTLLFLCCHPALTPASQIALTLRAVGGLTTTEIARAFLVPEATMAQRISRAKQSIKAAGATFEMPPEPERGDRLGVVLHVLYLIFNEGYTATSGADLLRSQLTGEAIRLARAVHRLLPDDGEVAGLLALMLLTDARRPARTGPDGELIPLAEQDRSRWDRASIQAGTALVTNALADAALAPYQLQAAIAAVHAEAARAEDTDWRQIVALYDVLARLAPSPVVTLNRSVAVAMLRGPQAGLDLLATLQGDDRMTEHHRLDAVRAHLLEMAGDGAAAREGFRAAARRTTSLPERRYLERRAARLAESPAPEIDPPDRCVRAVLPVWGVTAPGGPAVGRVPRPPRHSMSALRPTPRPVLVIGGPIERADVAGLCECVRVLLWSSDADAVLCDVGAILDPDVGTVDALARMQLTARRLGRDVHLRHANQALHDLLTLVGLCESAGLVGELRVGVGRETEEREQPRRVEEEGHPGDPVS